MARRMALPRMALEALMPLASPPFWPHGRQAGFVVAYMRADSRILSAGIQVISATFSGG